MFDDFFAARSYLATTRAQYRYILMRAGREFDLHSATPAILAEWLDRHAWGNATRWLAVSAIHAYLRWAFGDQHPALRYKIKRQQPGPQPHLTQSQAASLLQSFDDSPKGVRDFAIASLLLDTGLREFEICSLTLRGLHLSELWLSATIKGGRVEQVIFSATTAIRLRAWLAIRNELIPSPTPALFVSLGGIRRGTPLTPRGLQTIAVGWGRGIGIERLTPHQFRRSFAIFATLAGAPSRLVQIAGRWSSIEMVERYTKGIELEAFREYSPLGYVER